MSLHSDLQRYLHASPHHEHLRREDLLAAMREHILKCIRRFDLQDPEDAVGQCMVRLWPHIDAMKSSGRCTMRSFDAYVAGSAHNCAVDEIRRLSPTYRTLGSNIKALLDGRLNTSGLLTWDDPASREEIAGFDIWNGRAARLPKETFDDRRSREVFASRWLGDHDVQKCSVDILVSAVLSWNNAPMPVSHLINIIYRLRGSESRIEVSLDAPIGDEDGASFVDLVADPGPTPEEAAIHASDTQQHVSRLWLIMRGLDVRQIIAICLNLQQEEFTALVIVAGSRVIAGILRARMEITDLAEIIVRLPLPDREIAEMLGESEQTVRNIRAAARKTIARRYAKEFDDDA